MLDHLRFLGRTLVFAPDTGASGGNTPPATPPAQPTVQSVVLPAEAQQSYQNLLDRSSGNAHALAAQLYSENQQQRERNRQLQAQLDQQNQQYQGKTVLSAEDAQLFEAYKALGTPSALQQTSAAYQQVQQQQALTQAAQAAGFNADALKHLGGSLQYKVTSVPGANGQQVQQAYVVVKNGDQTQDVPLQQYAQQNWQPFLPVLQQPVLQQNAQQQVAHPGNRQAFVPQMPTQMQQQVPQPMPFGQGMPPGLPQQSIPQQPGAFQQPWAPVPQQTPPFMPWVATQNGVPQQSTPQQGTLQQQPVNPAQTADPVAAFIQQKNQPKAGN